MVNFVCDACKKAFPGAVRGKDYFTYLNKGLCVSCDHKLEESVRQEHSKKPSYSLSAYKSILRTRLNQICK